MAFSRDETVLKSCCVSPHVPVRGAWTDAGIVKLSCAAAHAGGVDTPSVAAYPPCGVLPHAHLAQFAVPLCYLYGNDFQVYHVFKGMVRRPRESCEFCFEF
jgi:hypothetical protein